MTITKLDEENFEHFGTVFAYKQTKNAHFYVSMKIMYKISHCCLVDGRSGPNVISKTIMEELRVCCANENTRNMLDFNKKKHPAIGEIKHVTLLMCSHLEIITTFNIQVIDVGVSNYSIIMGRDWKSQTNGYYSMDSTHYYSLWSYKHNCIQIR